MFRFGEATHFTRWKRIGIFRAHGNAGRHVELPTLASFDGGALEQRKRRTRFHLHTLGCIRRPAMPIALWHWSLSSAMRWRKPKAQLRMERNGFIEKLVEGSRRIGELESELRQLSALRKHSGIQVKGVKLARV
jgi:hypothetical protein